MVSTSRDTASFKVGKNDGAITVLDGNGNLLATFNPPLDKKVVWPMIEGSSPGASVYGGYAATLSPDASVLRCTRTGDGKVTLQMAFKKVPKTGALKLVLKRNYSGTAGGTESVQIYRWADWSYPYAAFDTLSSGAAPLSPETVTIDVPDIAPYIDFEGSVYIRIVTSGVDSGGELRLDTAYLRR
jgi:hypothetical protein